MRDRLLAAPLLLLAFAYRASGDVPPAAASLAGRERAFAKTCGAKGIRASFSEFFAPDAIDFEPGPALAKDSLPRQPDDTAPFVLDWEPVFVDVSAAGDLGYSTGPYLVTSRKGDKPPRGGYFFSVWKRAVGLPWRVALDIGTSGPLPSEPLRPASLRSATASRGSGLPGTDAEAGRAALLARDREVGGEIVEAWREDSRWHRDGAPPVVGFAAVAREIALRPGPLRATPLGGAVASSGDLAYTYGSYARAGASGPEAGYYARVWKREAGRTWKIAAQIERPSPPEKK